MNIFICGQKSFGREVLKELYKKHNIVGVAPPPQEKYYDKMQALAVKLGVPIISDCDKLTSKDIPDNTDLVVAAHSHWYISTKIREKVRYGAIGFHPSLLPRHRGQDAVRWTIAMNDPITGGTVFWLDDSVDGGDIIIQKHLFVDKNWDYHKLWEELFPVGIELLNEAIEMIDKGIAPRTPQENKFATWEPTFYRKRLKRNELLQLN